MILQQYHVTDLETLRNMTRMVDWWNRSIYCRAMQWL